METGKVKDYIRRSHEMAIQKGWWDEADRSPREIYALFHSEISEAVEECRHDRPFVYQIEDGIIRPYKATDTVWNYVLKPEGALIELADLCIRIFDYVGRVNQINMFCAAYEIIRKGGQKAYSQWRIENGITKDIEMYAELHCKLTDSNIGVVFGLTESFCEYKDWNLGFAIDMKMKYNSTRPHRHGGLTH